MNKELTTLMKGYAIIFIILHNLCHLEIYNFPQENEMNFSSEKFDIFLNCLFNDPSSFFYIFFSFIGWIGVPLFVFLSGYGLTKKYKEDYINIKIYLKHSWLKLFVLMLPGLIFFFSIHVFVGDWQWISRKLLAVALLNNLVNGFGGSFASSIAPPYWYLGMTLQLYVLFIFLRKLSDRQLLFVVVFPIILMFFLESYPLVLKWIRINAIGWLPFFALGIMSARKFGTKLLYSKALAFLLFIFSIVVVLLLNANYNLWLILPFFAVLMFISLSLLTSKMPVVSSIFSFVGRNSMYLFVAHPIVLKCIDYLPYQVMSFKLIVEYISVVLFVAWLYKIVHLKLQNILTLKRYD